MRYWIKHRKILQVSVFGLLSLIAIPAAATTIDDVRLWRAPDHTRLVFDLSNPASYELFVLDNPHRVVIDIVKSELKGDLTGLMLTLSLIHISETTRPERISESLISF